MIYADNAATTKMCPAALQALTEASAGLFGNPSSVHSAGEKAKDALENARAVIARCLNAEKEEIFFTSGGTESDATAILSAVRTGEKKHIISTGMEHPAVFETLEALARSGCPVTYVNPGRDGIIDAADIKKAVRKDTALISVMYANNETGAVQPVRQLGAFCRENDILFHTDAVHAAGHAEIDVKKDIIDMLSASAHKFGGPKGVGILFIRNGLPRRPLLLGGGQEKGLRSGTENVPAIVAAAAALREKTDHLEENTAHVLRLREILLGGLSEIPRAHLNGSTEHFMPGTLNVRFDGVNAEALTALADANGIAISAGSACAAGKVGHSRTLLSMGLSPGQAENSVRISVNEDNTEEETEQIISVLKQILPKLSSTSV